MGYLRILDSNFDNGHCYMRGVLKVVKRDYLGTSRPDAIKLGSYTAIWFQLNRISIIGAKRRKLKHGNGMISAIITVGRRQAIVELLFIISGR
jgi:hypothetical protein